MISILFVILVDYFWNVFITHMTVCCWCTKQISDSVSDCLNPVAANKMGYLCMEGYGLHQQSIAMFRWANITHDDDDDGSSDRRRQVKWFASFFSHHPIFNRNEKWLANCTEIHIFLGWSEIILSLELRISFISYWMRRTAAKWQFIVINWCYLMSHKKGHVWCYSIRYI